MLDLHLAKTLQTGRDDLDEDELAGVPQITKRILQNHPLTLLGALPDFIPFLQCLGKLSIQTICICSASDDDPIIESLEDFLDIWASLSLDAQSLYDERITFKQPITEFEFPSFFQLLKAVSAAVFGEYLGYILRFAEGHAMDDEEDTHGFKDYDLYADPLLNAASVARLDPSQSTQKLLQCLTERIQLLEQILKSGQADQRLGILYEQLHWLIILSGFVLADSGKGETPLVNDAIMQVSILYEGQDDDPIRGLATTLLRLLEMLSIDPSSPLVRLCISFWSFYTHDSVIQFNNLSPTLIETLFWFIERWGRTYLMIDASQYGQCR